MGLNRSGIRALFPLMAVQVYQNSGQFLKAAAYIEELYEYHTDYAGSPWLEGR